MKISRGVAEAILFAAAEQCKTDSKTIRARDRRRFVVEARQLVTGVLREGNWSFQEIADFLTHDVKGNHTSPLHWFKCHERDMEMYDYYRISFDQLMSCHDDNTGEFIEMKGRLIDIDIYMNLKTKYDNMMVRFNDLKLTNELTRSKADKLKKQITQLWN